MSSAAPLLVGSRVNSPTTEGYGPSIPWSPIMRTQRRRSGGIHTIAPPTGQDSSSSDELEEAHESMLRTRLMWNAVAGLLQVGTHCACLTLALYLGMSEKSISSPLRQVLIAFLVRDIVLVGKYVLDMLIIRAFGTGCHGWDTSFAMAIGIFDTIWQIVGAVIVVKTNPNDVRQAPILYWSTLFFVALPISVNFWFITISCAMCGGMVLGPAIFYSTLS